MKRAKQPLVALVADDLRQLTSKHPKQHIILAAGCSAGVTFTPDEEERVQAKAARLGISVNELIAREVNRRSEKSRRPIDKVLADVLEEITGNATQWRAPGRRLAGSKRKPQPRKRKGAP